MRKKIYHTVLGQPLLLMEERSLYWREQSALLVADLHLGKEGTFRQAGIPVPDGPTTETLARLSQALAATSAHRLVVLGDLFHGSEAIAAAEKSFDLWRRQHPSIRIDLISASHDRWSGTLPHRWQIQDHDEPIKLGPFLLRHYPKKEKSGYCLAGHLHPGVRLRDPQTRESMTLPCFHFTENCGVLPAFGVFTGLARVNITNGDHCFIVTDEAVIHLNR